MILSNSEMMEKSTLWKFFQAATLENLFQRNDRLSFGRMIPTIAKVCPCVNIIQWVLLVLTVDFNQEIGQDDDTVRVWFKNRSSSDIFWYLCMYLKYRLGMQRKARPPILLGLIQIKRWDVVFNSWLLTQILCNNPSNCTSFYELSLTALFSWELSGIGLKNIQLGF